MSDPVQDLYTALDALTPAAARQAILRYQNKRGISLLDEIDPSNPWTYEPVLTDVGPNREQVAHAMARLWKCSPGYINLQWVLNNARPDHPLPFMDHYFDRLEADSVADQLRVAGATVEVKEIRYLDRSGNNGG